MVEGGFRYSVQFSPNVYPLPMFDYDAGRSIVKFLQLVILVRKDSPFKDVTHRVTKVPARQT